MEAYNIRYWESQFRVVRPSKTRSGQRLYRRRDIELLLEIKHLLHDKGFTIAGAKKHLANMMNGDQGADQNDAAPLSGLAAEERRAYEDLLSTACAERDDLANQVANLKQELAELRRQHARQVNDLDTRISDLTDQLAQVRISQNSRIQVLQREREAADHKAAALQQELVRVKDQAEVATVHHRQQESRTRLLFEALRQELAEIARVTPPQAKR